MNTKPLSIGIDVGSTTVKAVLIDPATDEILWRDYQRHEGKQLTKTLGLLRKVESDVPGLTPDRLRVFATGSGAGTLESCLGAKFVQEVNAVALAVERLFPEVGSVIELGGQDAKIIIFKDDPALGGKKKTPTMNDKCAGGTGAILDKISAKLGIPPEELADQGYDGLELHHVAGKCGVFAETDINSLQLVGIPTDQLMASLFDAIVGQNLSVLTRGHTLRPQVLLLGGPNTFIRGMAEAWKANIPAIWEERDIELPEGVDPAELIFVPENAQFFAAMGTVEYGKAEEPEVGRYAGLDRLERLVEEGGGDVRAVSSGGLSKDEEDLAEFRRRYPPAGFTPAVFSPGERVRAFLGLDGGSTSTKGVLMDERSQVLGKAYQLSKGNPIEDTKEIVAKLHTSVGTQGASLEIAGFGVTGYAKDVLKEVFGADVAVVETVAHTTSALHFYDEVDVICDVGGQDIKIMVLNDGQVKDFKLNTQCSAGNGYFLQSTAQSLGIPVEEFADVAFRAKTRPTFGHGCAVFLQSDIVNFQRQGWKPEQILAGLAAVLPRNIWLYVAQIPNPARLGTRFILQGGTQHNLAAVKAQVDFLRERFKDKGVEPNILVHKHCGESGAIGAALEAKRVLEKGGPTSFIGLDQTAATTYVTTTDEQTRCRFCKNKCLRTFIDVRTEEGNGDGAGAAPATPTAPGDSPVPLAEGSRRLIVGNSCEKGLVESVDEMRTIKARLDATTRLTPNFSAIAARSAFKSYSGGTAAHRTHGIAGAVVRRLRPRPHKDRDTLRIGIPRVLAMYQTAPLFRTYLESLGIQPRNIVYSDFTSPKLYKEGAKRGSIDPCFPSKLAIPHVHNLIYVKHEREPLDVIFFPMIDDVPSDMESAIGHRICPTITATPEAVRAAFTKEDDVFGKKGIRFMNTFVNIGQPELFERQMYQGFKDLLGLSRRENRRAVKAGMEAMTEFRSTLRSAAKDELERLKRENRIGIVLLGRPYHSDKGINQDILAEFQKLGYPIFTPNSLPIDHEVLEPLFGEEVREGVIDDPLDVRDVWKNAYSENSNWKLWAAKFAARHPNLIALEINSFRCGHDAPISSVIESIAEASETPFFCFRDLDENKPSGSIKIRIETIHYFLTRFREGLVSGSEVRRRNRKEFSHPRLEHRSGQGPEPNLIQLVVEEEAQALEPRMVSRERIKRGLAGFGALTAAGLGIVFASTFRGDAAAVFGGLSPLFLWLAVLAMVADFLLGPFRMYVLLKHVVPETRFSLLFRADMAGRFLGAVTPSQTGGGPCQVFMMVRGGIPLPEVLSVLMVNFIATLILLTFTGGATVLIYQNLFEGGAIRYLLQWTFLAFVGGMVLAGLSLTRSDLLVRLLGRWRRGLLTIDAEWAKALGRGCQALSEVAERYRGTCVRCVAEWPLLPVVSLLLTVLLYLNKFTLGWFIVRGLGFEAPFMPVLAVQALLTFILYVAPTPGGSGVAELSTSALMAVVIPSQLLGPFTLAHRLFLMYLPAALGAFILAGAIRPKRQDSQHPSGGGDKVGLDKGRARRTDTGGGTSPSVLKKTAAVAVVCGLLGSILWPSPLSGQIAVQSQPATISMDSIPNIRVETLAQIRQRRMEFVNAELIRGIISSSRKDSLAAFSRAVDTAYAHFLANSDCPDAHYLYAVAVGQRLELSGTMEKVRLGGIVRKEAEAALALDSDHAGAHHVLGRLNAAAMRLGRIERFIARRVLGAKSLDGASWEKAEYHFKRAAELLPGDALNWVELAALYVDTHRKPEALQVLEQATEVPPMDPVRARGRERALEMLCSLDPGECAKEGSDPLEPQRESGVCQEREWNEGKTPSIPSG